MKANISSSWNLKVLCGHRVVSLHTDSKGKTTSVCYLTRPTQLSTLNGRENSTGQSAVMNYGCGAKVRWLILLCINVWVGGRQKCEIPCQYVPYQSALVMAQRLIICQSCLHMSCLFVIKVYFLCFLLKTTNKLREWWWTTSVLQICWSQ